MGSKTTQSALATKIKQEAPDDEIKVSNINKYLIFIKHNKSQYIKHILCFKHILLC